MQEKGRNHAVLWVVTEKGELSMTGRKNDGEYESLIVVRCTGKMQGKGRNNAVPRLFCNSHFARFGAEKFGS